MSSAAEEKASSPPTPSAEETPRLPYKAVMFDLDDTLIQETYSVTGPVLCKDTLAILDYLEDQSVKIILATHNYSADEILEKLDIAWHFDLVLAYYDYSDKASHLRKALQEFDLKPSEVVFYDDMAENTRSVRTQGADSVLVSQRTGVTLDQVKSKFE